MNCKCKVEQRRLTPGVFNLKQFLNGSETMVWEVDNCIINDGTCDLKQYDAFLTLCVGGEIDEILLTKRQTGDTLQLIWDVGTYATALTGYVKYQISFRSAQFDTLGVIADDPGANGVYVLTDQDTTGNDRVYSKAENGYSIKWDEENGRWALYRTDGVSVIDYQTTPNTEPHCGVWDEVAVGNNEAAAWISDEAIMYVSDSIAADQKVTGNYPTILRQLWAKINKAGVTSVNGQTGIVELVPADIGAAEETHVHEIADVNLLQKALDGKAEKVHTHSEFAEIKNKAEKSHSHKIADTEGLQDALDGKAPTEHGHTISNVTGLQDALNKKLPAAHTEAKATTAALGHVKVDGQTITVAEDGTIKANGGVAIGTIFPFPASVPPAGAYLLNGQTITGCNELYPKFWDWLQTSGVRTIDNATYEAELAATGVCGGFVVDGTAGSVRLPTVVNGTLWGADKSTVGQSLAAGLPNITGSIMTIDEASAKNGPQGAFWMDTSAAYTEYQSSSPGSRGATAFDASRSNSIYGNSDTVQPPAIRVSWCIQVYNAATALSEQESAQLASLMQTKAQTDLANVNSNIDYVVETWNDGAGGWYRKYRSGWVEQGGLIQQNGTVTVTFPIAFSGTDYTPMASPIAAGVNAGSFTYPLLAGRTTTTMKVTIQGSGANWYACGY